MSPTPSASAMGWGALVLLLALVFLLAGASPPAGAQEAAPLRPLVAALHVHSTASTGDLTLDQLAEQAERSGLDAVVLTDNFVLRYEYGLWPLRGVFKRTFSLPGVLDYGIGRYLKDVAAAQARHPAVLLVPGVEVVPHYFWTGSLFQGDLTMHNSQRNILVMGLPGAADYRTLPVSGNPASYRLGGQALLNLSPALLFVPAVWLWRRRRVRREMVGRMPYRTSLRRRGPALALAVAAGLLLWNAWPPTQPLFSAYDDQLGFQPSQTLIDRVAARGGVTIWSMPEARDFNEFSYGPLGKVTVKTDPYPEALLRTTGYTGFGGIYQDTRTVIEPGGMWDQALSLYLQGRRPAPPFAVGEIAFHGLNRDTRELDQVLSIFWVRERSAAGLLEALRAGRLYAAGQYRRGRGLRLDRFLVECEGGRRWALSGELLDPGAATDLAVRLTLSSADGGALPVTVTLVRDGAVVARIQGTTPVDLVLPDPPSAPGGRHFYRVAAEAEGAELLSNPIFVVPLGGGA